MAFATGHRVEFTVRKSIGLSVVVLGVHGISPLLGWSATAASSPVIWRMPGPKVTRCYLGNRLGGSGEDACNDYRRGGTRHSHYDARELDLAFNPLGNEAGIAGQAVPPSQWSVADNEAF